MAIGGNLVILRRILAAMSCPDNPVNLVNPVILFFPCEALSSSADQEAQAQSATQFLKGDV